MYEDDFPSRLTQLRLQRGVSARDMSLSIGQNPGYINNIESGKALPSMASFFFICEYLGITPQEFFDFEASNPTELRSIIENLKKIDSGTITNLSCIIDKLANNR